MPTVFCTPAEFAGTTITTTVLASDTSIPVASVAALKGNSTYPFYATLRNVELVKVTGDTGTAVTVVRGVDGTTAVAALPGHAIEQNANAQNVKDLNSAVNVLESSTTLNIQPSEFPTGVIDGLNRNFTLSHTPNGLLFILALNGLLQHSGSSNDFTLSGAVITFNTAPTVGDSIIATYTF